MEIAVGVLVAVAVGICASIWKMLGRNKDPKQQHLASMFIAAAISDSPADAAGEIGDFIKSEGWNRVKAAPRIAHALSLVRVVQPVLYERATEISRRDEIWAKIHGALNPEQPPHSN